MQRFDNFQQKRALTNSVPAPTTNGTTKQSPAPVTKRERSSTSPAPPQKRKAPTDSESELSEVIDTTPRKKPKKTTSHNKSTQETDEQIAKRLQAELNAVEARLTRGGGTTARKRGTTATTKRPTTIKKKSKPKIHSDDDSQLSPSSDIDASKPNPTRKGGFHVRLPLFPLNPPASPLLTLAQQKQMHLSPPLSALLSGQLTLSRPQTVKQIWAYVKLHDLQDPADKRMLRCDDKMRAVFGRERVHMFTMNKLLKGHLRGVDEVVGPGKGEESASRVGEGIGHGVGPRADGEAGEVVSEEE